MNALLPGGISGSDSLQRDFAFKSINGEIELALAESCGLNNISDAVTHGLCAALDHIGGMTAQTDVISGLAIGDRQFLMRQLNLCLGNDASWYSASCSACHIDFDFYLELSKMPIKEAGAGYPFARVQTSQGLCCFRVPNGRDQSVLSQFSNEEESCIALIRRCLVCIDDMEVIEDVVFSDGDRKAIEDALELVAPEVGCEVSVACLTCGAANTVSANPYALIDSQAQNIMSDIHKVASCYHWSEQEILSMPRQRRFQYLDLIDAARGIHAEHSSREM